jgi:hypothetical protein
MDDETRSGNRPVDTEADARAADLRFVSRGVTDAEAAAVTAVVLAALDEAGGAASVAEPVRDRWVRSGHALRSPIDVGPGNWSRSGR